MNLGEKLRSARLEKGLSQRQLCGSQISRNMLSLIENGGAKPSMDTLRYLAQALEKPVSYFLDDNAITSPNRQVMAAARTFYAANDPGQALKALEAYCAPDEVFDYEYALLKTLSCLCFAQQAMDAGKSAYAEALLEQARTAALATPYLTETLLERIALLASSLQRANAAALAGDLTDSAPMLLLRAHAAFEKSAYGRCLTLLDAMERSCDEAALLRGDALMAIDRFSEAAESYLSVSADNAPQAYAKLEQCYRMLGNYEKAYFYACIQR